MAKHLREWRTAQLLSIKDVAAAAQVTSKTLIDLEYGRRRPTERTIRQVSAALGVDPFAITEFAAALASRATLPDPETEAP